MADAILKEDHFAQDAGAKLYRYEQGRYVPTGECRIKTRIKAILLDWGELNQGTGTDRIRKHGRLRGLGPEGVTLKESKELPESASAAVAEVSEHRTESTQTVRFKLHDKLGALNSLAKHLGMFIERKEINSNTDWRFTIGKGYDGPAIKVVEIIMPPDSETERTETVDGVVTRVE